MKNLLHASFLVYAFCVCINAQTNGTSACPTVSVTGPFQIIAPNELVNYSITVDSKEKDSVLQYIWSVSTGEIVEGQGTRNVKIKQLSDGCITVSVEVKGLPINCPKFASETMCIDLPPQPIKIDEFSGSVTKIEKSRSEKLIGNLKNDPTAQLYVLFSVNKDASPRSAQRKSQEISSFLVRDNKIEAERITIIKVVSNTQSTQFWTVPAGATPPGTKDF